MKVEIRRTQQFRSGRIQYCSGASIRLFGFSFSMEICRIPSSSSKFQQPLRIGNLFKIRYAHLFVQNPRVNVDTGKDEDWRKLIFAGCRKVWNPEGWVIPRYGLKVCDS